VFVLKYKKAPYLKSGAFTVVGVRLAAGVAGFGAGLGTGFGGILSSSSARTVSFYSTAEKSSS